MHFLEPSPRLRRVRSLQTSAPSSKCSPAVTGEAGEVILQATLAIKVSAAVCRVSRVRTPLHPTLQMERSYLASAACRTCWLQRPAVPAATVCRRSRPARGCPALPVDKNKNIMDFLTAEGKSFDDLELDDEYYRCASSYAVLNYEPAARMPSWRVHHLVATPRGV